MVQFLLRNTLYIFTSYFLTSKKTVDKVAQLAVKYGNLSADFNEVLKEVSTAGGHLHQAAAEFVRDPFDGKKRDKVVRQARAVLS